MNVLYCIMDNRCGGPHRLAHDIALRLREHDIETLFLLGYKGGETWQPEGFPSFMCKNIQCFRRRAPIRNFIKFIALLPHTLARLRRVIKANDIDIVHVDGVTNFVPALAARLTGRPVIWLYNDYLPRPLRPVLMRLMTRLASRVLVQGDCLRKLTQSNPRLREKTTVLHSGVDTAKFTPERFGLESRRQLREELGLPADCTLIGTIRNVNRFKGLTYFIEAAAKIKSRVPSAKFAIVGRKLDTDPGYWDHLQQLTEQLGLKQDVLFTGFRDDVPAILSALDTFVLASIEESCPVALLEAMAMKVPVVATDVGAVSEMVLHARTGFVVPPRDPDAIADAVMSYLQMPAEQVQQMVEAARQRVEAQFAIEPVAQQQKHLYESMVVTRDK